jgi:hypothetical protein
MRATRTSPTSIRSAAFILGPALVVACATGVDPTRMGTGGSGAGTGTLASSSTGGTFSSGFGGSTTSASSTSTGGSSTASSTSTGGSSTASSTSTGGSSTASSTSTTSSTSSSGTVMGLGVLYLCAATEATYQELKPHLEIVNNGTSAVSLSSLTLRYFFTKDSTPATDLTFVCDYAQVGCTNLSGTFNTWTGTNADEYAEIAFQAGAGSIAPGTNSGEIQARIHPTDYAYMFTQTNDYSFDSTKTAYTPWTHVTLYQNGTLVWGTEP